MEEKSIIQKSPPRQDIELRFHEAPAFSGEYSHVNVDYTIKRAVWDGLD
jgi:hypothetical protein